MTFDLDRLTGAVKKAAAGETMGWPVYDRMLHNPVEDAVQVDGSIVLLEGNYLLLATIDCRNLKFILRKGTPEHDALTKTSLANLTEDMKQDLVTRFLLSKA